MSIADLRRDYGRKGLSEADVNPDPFAQLQSWLDEAVAASVQDANAMTLATVDASGRPSARIVLLRWLDADGLRFFTNYDSRKGRELAANPNAAVDFFWPAVERQVRVEGVVERLNVTMSDDYFRSRPRDAQLSTWVSDQSAVVEGGRAELESRFAELERRFAGKDIPRPSHWGGYRMMPTVFEFWQGRAGRLHDRICFQLNQGSWRIVRLAP